MKIEEAPWTAAGSPRVPRTSVLRTTRQPAWRRPPCPRHLCCCQPRRWEQLVRRQGSKTLRTTGGFHCFCATGTTLGARLLAAFQIWKKRSTLGATAVYNMFTVQFSGWSLIVSRELTLTSSTVEMSLWELGAVESWTESCSKHEWTPWTRLLEHSLFGRNDNIFWKEIRNKQRTIKDRIQMRRVSRKLRVGRRHIFKCKFGLYPLKEYIGINLIPVTVSD